MYLLRESSSLTRCPKFLRCSVRQFMNSGSHRPDTRSAADVREGSRLCENSDAELSRRTFVSTTSNKKRTALAGTIERRKERKQFCAFSACARFHTAWVTNGPRTVRKQCPVIAFYSCRNCIACS